MGNQKEKKDSCKKLFKDLHCVQKHLIVFKWLFTINGFTLIYLGKSPALQTMILIAGIFGIKLASDTYMKHLKEKNGGKQCDQ